MASLACAQATIAVGRPVGRTAGHGLEKVHPATVLAEGGACTPTASTYGRPDALVLRRGPRPVSG